MKVFIFTFFLLIAVVLLLSVAPFFSFFFSRLHLSVTFDASVTFLRLR